MICLLAIICKLFGKGVNCFMGQNVISEGDPISFLQEIREVSNLCPGLCSSSRNHSHIDWQV